jgi:hypothetical protein
MSVFEHAYKRFATEQFPLPSEKQVVAFERRIKSELPADFRQYILEFNGGVFDDPEIVPDHEDCPPSVLAEMNGIGCPHPILELHQPRRWELFDDNDPPEFLPIGETPLGDFIILVTELGENPGRILFKQAFGEFYYLAEGIEEFFGFLREATQG